MTEAMPFLQKYDITFLRPPAIGRGHSAFHSFLISRKQKGPAQMRRPLLFRF